MPAESPFKVVTVMVKETVEEMPSPFKTITADKVKEITEEVISPFKTITAAKTKEITEETISPFKTVPASKPTVEVKKERLYREVR